MIRISNLKLNIDHDKKDLENTIIKKLRINHTELLDFVIIKKSLDARDKTAIFYNYTVDADVKNESLILKRKRTANISFVKAKKYQYPLQGCSLLKERPIIIGSGPAGLFAGYLLAKKGYKPLLIERGECVEERLKSVEHFWNTGDLDPSSNIQFGEGGAGTFSDGKLNTGVNDLYGRNQLVLQTFVENGAPEKILYENKPHVGTDILAKVVANMRNYINCHGGEVRFKSCFDHFLLKNGKAYGIATKNGEQLFSEIIILAIGHSARDTFSYLIQDSGLNIEAKAFAVGVRVEHLQEKLNLAQYGPKYFDKLPAADYKLTYQTKSGKNVYSFCMCPGGYVVNSSSENGFTCINGMSYSGRDSQNANSAIVVAVKPSDLPGKNIEFQRILEKNTFLAGNGKIVSQKFSDFENKKKSESFGTITPVHKGMTTYGNIWEILPEDVCENILEAMHAFAKKIKGFDDPDVILSAVESRTSSPIRILRDEQMQANIKGIYPIGEGAGYAGGITSAAIDGIKVFEKIYTEYAPLY